MNLPEILSEKGAKGENITDKVGNRVSFPTMFSPLGVGGMDKRRPEILKLMAKRLRVVTLNLRLPPSTSQLLNILNI